VEDDEGVIKSKGHPPVIPLKDRISALEALKFVDLAVPYKYRDYVSFVENYSINVLVLSEEYKYNERFNEMKKWVINNKGKIIYLPYYDEISSTKIKEKIKNDENNIDTT